MEGGLATYAANPNVGQYKGTSGTMPAPGPKKVKKKKKGDGMGANQRKRSKGTLWKD